jgi:hypothetical protein
MVKKTKAPKVKKTKGPMVKKTKAPKVKKTKAPKMGKGMDAKAPKAGKGMDTDKRSLARRIDTAGISNFSSKPDSDYVLPSSREHKIATKCGSTIRARSESLLSVLSSVSSLDALQNVTAAEHQAYNWINNDDELIVCPHTKGKVLQRYVAAQLYFSMNGNAWLECGSTTSEKLGDCSGKQNWLSGSHECEWFGVSCGSMGRSSVTGSIVSIKLKKNNLQGTIPTELFLLSDLTSIELADNKHIGGSIPASISNLNKLAFLDLSNNALTGSLPEMIYDMTSLKSLNIASNRIGGRISEDVSHLIQLSVLHLDDNELTGPVPATGLAALENLSKYMNIQSASISLYIFLI